MRVFYDHQCFSFQKFGGVSRYFAELIRHLPEQVEWQIICPFCENYYLEHVLGLPARRFITRKRFKGKVILNRLVNDLITKLQFDAQRFDIYHPTYYSPFLLKKAKSLRLVVTVHDMLHELYPESFNRLDLTPQWKRIITERADHIIAVSENTKQDLMRLYGLSADRITVIYHGVPSLSEPEPVEGLPERYFLYVGRRDAYKNFEALAKAMGIYRSRYDSSVGLVCAGGREFSSEERDLLSRLGIEGQVVQLSVTDGQLAYLYSRAIAFVFPSKYEGFGIPVLEAFSYDCPVLAANRSSLPEVGGNAALYFDPEDYQDLAEKMYRVASDQVLRQSLIDRGRERLKNFSWEKTARQTVEVYAGLL